MKIHHHFEKNWKVSPFISLHSSTVVREEYFFTFCGKRSQFPPFWWENEGGSVSKKTFQHLTVMTRLKKRGGRRQRQEKDRNSLSLNSPSLSFFPKLGEGGRLWNGFVGHFPSLLFFVAWYFWVCHIHNSEKGLSTNDLKDGFLSCEKKCSKYFFLRKKSWISYSYGH